MRNETTLKPKKMITLTITGTDYETNNNKTVDLKASNAYMLAAKYLDIIKSICVENWTIVYAAGECGNRGLNAGAYLCEQMEELTGLDLA